MIAMSATLHDCLRWALDARGNDARPVTVCFGDSIDPEAAAWADAIVPDGWERRSEPLSRWADWAAEPERDADRVLIVAPFVRLRDLPGGDQVDHAAEGWRTPPVLSAWLLPRACANGRPSQRFSALLPYNAFAGSLATKPREDLLAHADVLSWIEAAGPWNDDLGVHRSYRMALLTVAVREDDAADRPPVRFLRLHGAPDEAAVRRSSAPCSGRPAERRRTATCSANRLTRPGHCSSRRTIRNARSARSTCGGWATCGASATWSTSAWACI